MCFSDKCLEISVLVVLTDCRKQQQQQTTKTKQNKNKKSPEQTPHTGAVLL